MISIINKNSFLIFSSLIIMALGHPAIVPFFCLFASTIGLSFFWRALIDISSQKQKFFLGFGYFSIMQAVQLWWLVTTKYHGTGIVIVYLLLVILIGLQGGLFSLLFQNKNLSLRHILLFPAVWALMEWSRLYFFSGFAFNQLGLSWTFSFFPMQFAALGGVFFLSFWTILCNMLFLKLLLTVNKRKYSCLFTCFVAIPFIYGLINVKVQEAKIKESQHINVALIQTGLQIEEKSIMEKWIDAFIHPLDQWQRILAFLLTEKTQHPLDLIVLPEYALPFVDHLCIYSLEDVIWMLQQHIPSKDLKNTLPILKEPYAKQSNTGKWMVSNGYIAQFISNYFHANLILGLDTVNKKTNESYNAAFFFKPFEEHSEYYIKQKLLPLAEYMPLKLLEKISEGYGITSFFTPGNNAGIFEGEEYRYSPSICYEECFPHVIRKSRLLHPNILVNITNDGWYPFSNLPQVHFVHGKLRSVELGTSLVRSCNSGVTCALNPLGKVIDSLPILSNNQFYQGILYCSVPTYIYITPYVIWGDAFVLIISSLCVLFFAFPYRKKKNSSC